MSLNEHESEDRQKEYYAITKAMDLNARQQDIKDRLLDAADRLLARYGYRKMTMDDLANEVGIGKGTIYLHFRSKEDLVLSHVDRVIFRVIESLERIAQGNLSPAEKVRAMLVSRVMLRFDSVQHFPESLSEILRDLRISVLERRQHHFRQEAKVFAKALRQGERDGVFNRHDHFAIAEALVDASNSLLPFNLSTRELGKRGEVERRVSSIAAIVLSGLVKHGRVSKRQAR